MTEEVEVGQKWTSKAGLTVTVKRVGSKREIFNDLPAYRDLPSVLLDTDTWILTECTIMDCVGESRQRLESFLKIYDTKD
jgi:hypothetical protein